LLSNQIILSIKVLCGFVIKLGIFFSSAIGQNS